MKEKMKMLEIEVINIEIYEPEDEPQDPQSNGPCCFSFVTAICDALNTIKDP